MQETASPWWYRRRALMFGLVYFAGFATYWRLPPATSPPPAVVTIGQRFGAGGVQTLVWIGAALVVLAWAARVWGAAYLSPAVVWEADAQRDRLIVAGPFRFVRNPLYVGNLLMAVAFGLLAPPVGTAVIVLGNLVLVTALALHEALLLHRTYGATFAAYRAAVPALVPRLTPATVPGSATVEPAFRAALAGEIAVGCAALGMICVALFGQPGLSVLWVLMIAGLTAQTMLGRNRKI